MVHRETGRRAKGVFREAAGALDRTSGAPLTPFSTAFFVDKPTRLVSNLRLGMSGGSPCTDSDPHLGKID